MEDIRLHAQKLSNVHLSKRKSLHTDIEYNAQLSSKHHGRNGFSLDLDLHLVFFFFLSHTLNTYPYSN